MGQGNDEDEGEDEEEEPEEGEEKADAGPPGPDAAGSRSQEPVARLIPVLRDRKSRVSVGKQT